MNAALTMAMTEARYAAEGKDVIWINPKAYGPEDVFFSGRRKAGRSWFPAAVYESDLARQLREYAETFGIVLWTDHGPVGVQPATAEELVGRRRPRTSSASKRLADDAVVSLQLR